MELLAHRAGLAVVAVVSAVVLGSLLYLLVSFAVMVPHAAARPFRRVLPSMLREALAMAVTQPLLPLFYVLGRRMGGARDGRPIVFVHGYFQNRVDFLYLAAAARRAGLGPLYGFNYDFTQSIALCAARLAAFVEAVCRETGRAEVALVAHSLGGVISLEYLSTPAGTARVKRCVTIASPHAGVLWRAMVGRSARELHVRSDYMRSALARALPIRVLSIYSSHDNIVHPSSTSVLTARGGDDREMVDAGHLGMLFSREVADAVIRALA